jgi:hypothetical protein
LRYREEYSEDRKRKAHDTWVQEHTNIHGKWPRYKIKYRKIIKSHMKRRYLKTAVG